VRSYPKSRNPIRASSSSISTSTHIPPQVDSVSPTNRRWEGHRKHAHKRPLGNIKLDKETLSDYRVKRSRKWPRQQRAIEWITEAGKDHFDHRNDHGTVGCEALLQKHLRSCPSCVGGVVELCTGVEKTPKADADLIVCSSFLPQYNIL